MEGQIKVETLPILDQHLQGVENSSKNENQDSQRLEYSNEQKIVAATWWHERHYNHQSSEDIKNNFKIRFKMEAPKVKVIIEWEKQLFSHGKVVSSETQKKGIDSEEDICKDNSELNDDNGGSDDIYISDSDSGEEENTD